MEVVYTALFVDDIKQLFADFSPVHKSKYGHHMTIAFKPGTLDGITIGAKHVLKIIGRAVDGKADVLLVESEKSANKYPHITLSTIKGVSPVYANELLEIAEQEHLLEYFNEPYEIEVTEGYFDGEKDIIV